MPGVVVLGVRLVIVGGVPLGEELAVVVGGVGPVGMLVGTGLERSEGARPVPSEEAAEEVGVCDLRDSGEHRHREGRRGGMTGGDAPRVRPYVGKAVIVTPGRVAGMLADPDDPESTPTPPPDHPQLRSNLAAHVPYSSLRPWVQVRLDTNESPWPPPAALRVGLGELAVGHDWHRYGDLDALRLRTRLGAWHGHAVEGVWLAAGIFEVLQQVLLAYGGPGRTVQVPEPTWGGYRHLAALTGTQVTGDHRADVLVVCSPNNPTGEAAAPRIVARLCQANPASLVVVDEAYHEYAATPSALELLGEFANLAVVRSFSKALGLADPRLAYLLAHPEIVAGLKKVRLPYHPSGSRRPPGCWPWTTWGTCSRPSTGWLPNVSGSTALLRGWRGSVCDRGRARPTSSASPSLGRLPRCGGRCWTARSLSATSPAFRAWPRTCG